MKPTHFLLLYLDSISVWLVTCQWTFNKHQAITGNNFMKLIINFLPLKARLWSGTLKTQLSENSQTHKTMDITGTTVAASHRFWVRVAGYCSSGDEAEKMKAVVSLRFLFLLWNSIYISVGTHAYTVISAETKCSLCSWYKIPLKWMGGNKTHRAGFCSRQSTKQESSYLAGTDETCTTTISQIITKLIEREKKKTASEISNCAFESEMSENKSVRKQK